jgi:GT2 family glycosyltransferase
MAFLKTQVVVLNWNGCDMTANCLRSLLALRSDDFKILVIDNGSSDGSVEYLREQFPQVEVIPQGRNLGFAAGCNVGMKRALEDGAEYILLVNNDTKVAPDMLGELVCEAEKNPSAAVVSPKILHFDFPDLLWWAGGRYSLWQGVPSHVGRRERDRGQYDQAQLIDWATGCVMLLRCKALREVGLFDEQIFGNGEDLDLCLRVRERGWKIRYAPRAKVWHREGVDYRRNVGEHVRKFTYVRNILWVMHKHARPVQWFTFWPFFLLWHFPVLMLQCLLRKDAESAKALFGGVQAYFRMLKHPEVQVLPTELVRTTLPSSRESRFSPDEIKGNVVT